MKNQYKKILSLREKRLSFRQIAKKLGKSVSTIYEQYKIAVKVKLKVGKEINKINEK